MNPAGSPGEGSRAAALGLALAVALAVAMSSQFSHASEAQRIWVSNASKARGGTGARRAPGGPGAQDAPEITRSVEDPHALLYSAGSEENGLEARLSSEAKVRFMGEMQEVVRTLETRVSRPGYSGAVRDAVQRIRSFCRHAYRVLGRDPAHVSMEDARTALHDAALLQTRAANSISSLFMTAMRDRKRCALREARDAFLASSEAHISEMRRAIDAAPTQAGAIWRTGRSGAYEPGRGFPAPWGGAESEGHCMFGSGAESRYRVASEM